MTFEQAEKLKEGDKVLKNNRVVTIKSLYVASDGDIDINGYWFGNYDIIEDKVRIDIFNNAFQPITKTTLSFNKKMKKPKEIELSPLFDEILNEHKKRERLKIIKNPFNYITLIVIVSLLMPLFIHNNPRNYDADIVLVGITFFFLMFTFILIIILKK